MKRGNELAVGTVVFIALVLLVAGVISFGDYEMRAKKYPIRILFTNVEGLQKGDPITLSGVKVGNVKSMAFHESNRGVVVTASVRQELKIPDDSEAYVTPVGMMGEKAISLRLGEHETMLRPEGAIKGAVTTDLAQLTVSAAPVLGELRDILQRLRELLNQQTEDDLRKSLTNMGEITTGMRRIVTNDLHNLGAVMQNVEGVTSNLRDMSGSGRTRIDSVLSNVEETSERLSKLSESLTATSESLNGIAQRLNRGEGTLGRLLTDDGLYERIQATVSGVDSLTRDLRAHPEKYLQVRVF